MCMGHGLPPNYSELHPSGTKLSKETTPNWSGMFRHTDAPSSCRQERRISKNEGSGHREHEHCGERIAPRDLLTQQLTDNAPCCTNRLTQTAERVNAAINVQKMTQAEDGEFFALDCGRHEPTRRVFSTRDALDRRFPCAQLLPSQPSWRGGDCRWWLLLGRRLSLRRLN